MLKSYRTFSPKWEDEITIKENKGYTSIIMKEFGEGISKEDLPHIFKRFYKEKNATVDSVGIGLVLAKTIIERDNGNISVTSDSKGTISQMKYYKK